ncbi:hypothetical protein MASR2M74_12910 [Paracoccaceae bacterium]
MALIRSRPQIPVPWQPLFLSVVALWLAPVLVGVAGLAMYGTIGKTWAEFGLGVWFVANALAFSPLFSWVGWLIALPPVWAALRLGWFGWLGALVIGAAAGAIATEVVQTPAALAFGIGALLVLRAVLGRLMPL